MKLFHFSENPAISLFEPHIPATNPDQPPLVWAIDEEHAPHYYFPRDCPRVIYWITSDTTPADIDKFFAHTTARKIIAIEGAWLHRIRNTRLYAYHLPGETFECIDPNAGYYVSRETVKPLWVEPVEDLLERVIADNIELRVTPSLWKLHHALVSSSVSFSMIRMRNASLETD
ncbi:DUF6886 family protein [Lihuaxuella thermophila]|uniref:Uncharacterized protein n=1 Tax=Lihuaxuella thermophila TaxID=1173111 RepID=A0A1H8BQF3_9BACL|nr:DUF6886 family protein [Lihuaxuella thermophila]SEM84258.1 hypothetical protein SAMN05444955_102275 [Lihuaxuella thermophila]